MISSFEKKYHNKRLFNPRSKKDVETFKKFLIENRWGGTGCPFILENPYISIPHMIQDKMVKNLFGINYEQSNS
jgi:hypothetical protein